MAEHSIKLGLGDFVFYSVLVSRAATHGFATFAACSLVILGVRSNLCVVFPSQISTLVGFGNDIGAFVGVSKGIAGATYIYLSGNFILFMYSICHRSMDRRGGWRAYLHVDEKF